MAALHALLPHRDRCVDPPRGSLARLQSLSQVDTPLFDPSADAHGRANRGGGLRERGMAGAVGHGRHLRSDGLDSDGRYSTSTPGIPGTHSLVGHDSKDEYRGPSRASGTTEHDENYGERYSIFDEVTGGKEAEEKGNGGIREEELATAERISAGIGRHAVASDEEAELERQLATMSDRDDELVEGSLELYLENYNEQWNYPEFPPQPPAFLLGDRLFEDGEGSLTNFVTRKRKVLEEQPEEKKGVRKKELTDKPWTTTGVLPQRHEGKKTSAESRSSRRDLPLKPKVKGIDKTNQKWKKAIQTARFLKMNRGKHTGSLQDFRMAYYANSSRKAKASIRKTVNKILNNLGVKGTNECWTVEVLEQVGAVLRSSEYKAGVTYLAEYKNMLIEKGNVWTHQLQRAFAQASRALKRARGPAKKAMEVDQDRWLESYRAEQNEKSTGAVHNPALMFAFAATWMLREVELAAVYKEDIAIDPKERIVSLTLRISKGDQEAMGLKRTLQCDCQSCDWTEPCPYNIAKRVLGNTPIETDRIVHGDGEGVVEKSQTIAAWRKLYGKKVSGHSGRRSGALQYIRRGWHVPQVAYLGRWKSNVILQYAEEALETMPVMARSRRNTGTPPPKTEIITKTAEEPGTKVLEKVKETGAKLKKEIEQLRAMQDKLDESIDKWEEISIRHQGLLPPVVISKAGLVHENRRQPVASPVTAWHTRCGWPYGSSNFCFGQDITTVTCLKCKTLALGIEEKSGKGGG